MAEKQLSRAPLKLYVAVDGDDRWTGELPEASRARTDGPLATLTGARNAIRRMRHAGGGQLHAPVVVLVRGGTYRMSEPLRLSAGDSGSAECPITYAAYPGETPVLSGGRVISEWKPHQGKILRCELSDVRAGLWWFRQLFCDNRRMVRARWPKFDRSDPLYGGWAFVDSLLPDTAEPLPAFEKHELELTWRFKTDAAKTGVEQRWFSSDVSDTDWQSIRVDDIWHRQGHKQYHGDAWYRLGFAMPEHFDRRQHLWLSFAAVDKECWIYIDGKLVFEHTVTSTGKSVEDIWDEPFQFDVRPYLTPGKQSLIAVRVRSEAFGGGIFKPVWLVSADAQIDSGILRGEVPRPTAFRFEPGVFPHRWAKPQQGEVFVVPGKSWISDIIPVKSVDLEQRAIKLTRPVGPSAHTLGSATHIVPGNRYFVENNLEDLTEPGEWCLDAETGTLFFWPPDDVPAGVEVVAPATVRLIQLIGSANAPVHHVNICGFTLRHTQAAWPTPESYYKTPNAGQTVYLESAEDCAIEENVFDAVGGDAIRLQNANARCRIRRNTITEAGGYGIFVGGLHRGFCRHDSCSGDVPSPGEWHQFPEDRRNVVLAWPRSVGHEISDNYIHHVGRLEKHGQGIAFYGVSAIDVVVAHNRIEHTPRFGIGLMSGFGRVTIEYNDLRFISEETCDTGGICFNRWYTDETVPELSRGCIVRFNRVRDVIGCGAYGKKMELGGSSRAGGRVWTPYYSWAIYFDNAPMDVHVHGNICARNTLGGLMISHYGKNVTVENNIFAASDKSQVYLLFAGAMSNIRIRRNIFSYAGADYLRLNLGPKIDLRQILSEYDHNVLFDAAAKTGSMPSIDGLPGEAALRTQMNVQDLPPTTMATWRQLGFDVNSVLADPKFADTENDNYDLKPDSPALKIGFIPINATKIGPRSPR